MNHKINVIIFLVINSLVYCNFCFAAGFPYTLNYQGMLTSKTGQPVNEPQDITFNLYTAPIGAELPFWTETLVKVPVSNGQLSVTLGTVNTLDPSKFNGDTYLGIKVGTQAEMLPRQKMTSVPYAFNGVPRGGIIMWSGDVVPPGWALCDGKNGTPNLADRFIVSVGAKYAVGPGVKKGAEYEISLQHNHSLNNHTHDMKNHTHRGYGDGGDLRAAIGAANADNKSLAYVGVPAGNPNNGSLPGPIWVVRGDSVTGFSHWSHYTAVYGYTSTPSDNSTDGPSTPGTSSDGNVAQDIRPPYFALAFIMKL